MAAFGGIVLALCVPVGFAVGGQLTGAILVHFAFLMCASGRDQAAEAAEPA